jgi:hypothetical protein
VCVGQSCAGAIVWPWRRGGISGWLHQGSSAARHRARASTRALSIRPWQCTSLPDLFADLTQKSWFAPVVRSFSAQ